MKKWSISTMKYWGCAKTEAKFQNLRTCAQSDFQTRTALEAAGVIFVAENGEGPGVRLKKGT